MTERCSECFRAGVLGGDVEFPAMYACGDDRLYCQPCLIGLVNEATDTRARCAHGRLVFAEGCDSCWLEARTRP